MGWRRAGSHKGLSPTQGMGLLAGPPPLARAAPSPVEGRDWKSVEGGLGAAVGSGGVSREVGVLAAGRRPWGLTS